MIACIAIPAFALRAPLLRRPELRGKPVALAPAPGAQPLLGPCNAIAERAGIRPGMRLSEALATCPELQLVEQDPAEVEEEWERLIRRLEEAGLAVEPVEPGCAYFETTRIERLAGGLDAALQRALDAVGPEWKPRVGAASRRFAALAAATVAPAGQPVVVDDGETRLFLEPLPLHLLPLSPERREELGELGVKRLGELARLPGAAVADRLGADGAKAWRLARGDDETGIEPRKPPAELAESLSFPEPIANELTLGRAVAALVERLLARPERAGRAPRPHVARADGGARPPATCARAQARRAAGSHRGAAPRAGRANRVGRDAGGARPSAWKPPAGAVARGSSPGAGVGWGRRRLHGRGGGAVVARPREQSDSRSARRLNEPRSALVVAEEGVPAQVGGVRVAGVREEWRVVDRWWTEAPVRRRYFEVLLETGRNTVVFEDGERGGWFTQRP